MKIKINSLRNAECGMRNENAAASGTNSLRPSPFALRPSSAFTLIELLVVISIIGVLAAFTVPVMKQLKRREYINKTQAELAQLETAIDSYKATHGFYPPNGLNCLTNVLYFELLGTTNDTPSNPNNGTYYTLDHSASIVANSTLADLGVGGFINCTKGSGEDAAPAKNFLPELKPGQYGTNTFAGPYVNFLFGSVGGPDQSYKPLGLIGSNPWRYVCPGTNNPTSYDLWIVLSIANQKNLICNWTKGVQKNTTLP